MKIKGQASNNRIYQLAEYFTNILITFAAIGFGLIGLYTVLQAVSAHNGQMSLFVDAHLYYLYGILAAFGMVACLLAFRLPKEYRINLALTSLSGIFGLYLIEIVLFINAGYGIVEDGRKHAKYAWVAGVPFDTRTRLEVINDFKQQGIEVYPDVSPHLFLGTNGIEINNEFLFPLSSISKKRIILCNENGEYSLFSSDEHGFNNPPGLFTHNDIEMMLIGDSFTQGACVKPEETISSFLRKNGKSVINLGKSDTGPLLELATLTEYARPKYPKILLWLYYEENDLRDLSEEQSSPFLLRYLEKDFSQNLLYKQRDVDKILEWYIENKTQELKNLQVKQFSIAAIKIVKLWHLRNKLGLSRRLLYPSPSPLFTKILEKARNTTSGWGGQLYFIYLPTWERYAKEVDHNAFMYRRHVLSIVEGLNIPLIDIHQTFQQHQDPLSLFPFRVSGHYTKEGYRLVAKTIITELEIGRHEGF